MLHNLVVRVLDLYWVTQPIGCEYIHYVDIVVIFVVTSFHIHGRSKNTNTIN